MGTGGKKICFITTTSITLKSFVVETAVMLHEALDMDITFICDMDSAFTDMLPEFIHYIPIPMKRGIDPSGIKTLLQLIGLFKKEKYDMVQYSTPNAALYASWAAKITKIPVRLYGQWGIRYVGFSGYKRGIFKLIEKFTCCNSTDIRAVSFMNLDFAVNERLYPREKGRVLGLGGTIGVDLNRYDTQNSRLYDERIRKKYNIGDSFVYGFVGRFSRDKGANELLGAFKELSDTGNVTLLCVGGAEIGKGVNGGLYEWAQKSDKVIFTGQVGNAEVKDYYAAMDCYVHPSYREGFGMVLQEAAAMECPIITTKIPGASEVMEEGISCILVEPGSTKALYRGMDEMRHDKKRAESMGKEARKRVEKYFDRRIMLKNQLEDYRNLVNT